MPRIQEMSPQALADACAKTLWQDDRASQHLGIEILHIAPGEATLSMTITEIMCNGHGNAHGGYLFTLADTAFAFACNTYNQITVAQHCSVTYIRPGAVGDVLTATAREVSRSGRSGIYDVQLSKPDGTVIAQFRGNSRTINNTLLADEDATV